MCSSQRLRFSNLKLGVVSPATGNPTQDAAISNVLECSYVDAAYRWTSTGNAQAALDPTQDTAIVGTAARAGSSRPRR